MPPAGRSIHTHTHTQVLPREGQHPRLRSGSDSGLFCESGQCTPSFRSLSPVAGSDTAALATGVPGDLWLPAAQARPPPSSHPSHHSLPASESWTETAAVLRRHARAVLHRSVTALPLPRWHMQALAKLVLLVRTVQVETQKRGARIPDAARHSLVRVLSLLQDNAHRLRSPRPLPDSSSVPSLAA